MGEDGEKHRWFMLPHEANLYISGCKPNTDNFKMPFFPRKCVGDSRISSRAPSKSVNNPHVCATCGGAGIALWDEHKKGSYNDRGTGEHLSLYVIYYDVCIV